jgi:hypothetical protein
VPGAPWGALALCLQVVVMSLWFQQTPALGDTANLAIGLTHYEGSVIAACYSDGGTNHGTSGSCLNDDVLGSGGDSWFPNDSYQCTGTCSFRVGYYQTGGTEIVTSVGLEFKYSHPGHFIIKCATVSGGASGYTYYTSSSYPAAYTRVTATLSSPCDLGAHSIVVENVGDIGSGKAWGVNEFQLYGTTEINCGDGYINGLLVGNFLGVENFNWTWRQEWYGTLSLRRHSGDYVTYGGAATTTEGHGFARGAGYVAYDLVIGDASDNDQAPWQIIVNDQEHGHVCVYDIQEGDSGEIIPVLLPPVLTWVVACYAKNDGQCGVDGVATHAYLTEYLSDGQQPSGDGDAYITVGPHYLYGPGQDTASLCSTGQQDYGTSHTFDCVVDTAKSNTWVIMARNDAGNASIEVNLDFAAGGTVIIKPPTTPGTVESCGDSITELGCKLSNGFALVTCTGAYAPQIDKGELDPCWITRVAGAVSSRLATSLDSLRTILLNKQPFAWIGRVQSGAATQIARALGDISSTTDCPGITFTLDSTVLPASIDGHTVFPSARPSFVVGSTNYGGTSRPSFTILRCADFEGLVSTTQYQVIRAFLDDAIIVLVMYREVYKRLTPKLVMGS